jgi:2-polyprenyl-3-methyl-5-hydroxy-6-metoxy-1,4-benzoquinol methylase
MDVVERLPLEAASSHELIACEHRHRYQFAAPLCRGRSVLDLCCGSGYGSEILAAEASAVTAVDNDVATIEMARSALGGSGIEFEAADAIAFLGAAQRGRFDVIVCFEGLEHLAEPEAALALLREHAAAGTRLLVSVPNSRFLREDNPYHLTDFGYEEAREAFAGFPSMQLLPQYLAEGSLIVPAAASGSDVSVTLDGRDDPGYANHFIACAGFAEEEVAAVHHGRMQVEAAPAYNRHMKALERAYADLRRANARLTRQKLGKSGSAAASFLATADAWYRRYEAATARVAELEQQLQRLGAREPGTAAVSVPAPAPAQRCMNTWEDRYRRARETLIPWIEQTVELEGRTVLEYGCGNAPVSCAFAERVGRHVGIDIDAAAVETGRRMARERGVANLELQSHPVERAQEAMAELRGEVDVVLLYAVLEHLTLEERLAVLRLAREVVRPEGHIVVCETPNRLFPIDHHTSQLPFFTMLPDELALLQYERSQRPDFLHAIAEATLEGPEAAREQLTRWGRGVSYHELELVFGDLADYVAASNYEPALFAERPVQAEELALQRLLDRVRPDLAPVFSRAWLDLVLTAWPLERRPRFLRPWPLHTADSPGVSWTTADRLWLPDAEAKLSVRLPAATSRLVVGCLVDAKKVRVEARSAAGGRPASVAMAGEPGDAHYASFDLAEPSDALEVSLDRPGEIVFVGYEG